MSEETKNMTKYFRSAVAAQANTELNFEKERIWPLSLNDVIHGIIAPQICTDIFTESKKNSFSKENKSTEGNTVNVIICAKTIKTIFTETEKQQKEFSDVTGIYYIPAILNTDGSLLFSKGNHKLPWFPREYLFPMIEPKLAVGNAEIFDTFISDHLRQINDIESWSEYAIFFTQLYEIVTETHFNDHIIRNLSDENASLTLEQDAYIFLDTTVYPSSFILKLYDHLLQDNASHALYKNFVSLKQTDTEAPIENDTSIMTMHCGQMSGEYPLSSSQREVVNHFHKTVDGDILAVNGPPGTGKTTLLQTIVADMYVQKAIDNKKPPLIVASSTNNQAVTNIIESFGNIRKVGISNLEDRWIEGVNSFATYFPSSQKIKEAQRNGFQCTTQKGEFFVAGIEDEENLQKSKHRFLKCFNKYFGMQCSNLNLCQAKLHEELVFLDSSKNRLLSFAGNAAKNGLTDGTIDNCIDRLAQKLLNYQKQTFNIQERYNDWKNFYKQLPWYVRCLKFIKKFSDKIQTEIRMYMNPEEQDILDDKMSIDEIKELYSKLHQDCMKSIGNLESQMKIAQDIKVQYEIELQELQQHNIILRRPKNEVCSLAPDYINNLLDRNHRYLEFWLAVHYYECRWVSGEDTLTSKQKGRNFENVLKKFYSRLSMLTPCMVMTFFMLPKQFMAFDGQNNVFMYDYIDLLIVDEAGQVSPEIAASAFSLAKKSIVVGDIHQIEPVWSVCRGLDKALALSSHVISSTDDFNILEKSGLNTSQSSVMYVASKCCKYSKFGEKGLFLCEHRRCYDEIIDYCNKLVYKGRLQPMRGKGREDSKRAIKEWPQMGFKQIDTTKSEKKGCSRINRLEAAEIVEWLKCNFDFITNAYPNEPAENLVGIITPFKAQVKCIKSELRKHMPTNYSKISVGTVHTFQGAERKIIIMSTVYGKQDGCFFIDSNKSLMNVAVSRAKDNFFVFGDINCLKDTETSASGLLKSFIKNNQLPDPQHTPITTGDFPLDPWLESLCKFNV